MTFHLFLFRKLFSVR